ncbi:MAG: cation-translocating P-type ATPase, partial [Candidatus Methanomethylophilaceae archaeon]|nr:cation-translocating P-type ATPase [Candidatus Methanomethylophilaceae archaeon]
FDKTGTLTTGVIHSLGFTNVSSDMPTEKVEGLVASLESRSEHPLGMAITADHKHIGNVEEFLNIPGKGAVGTVDGIRIAAGNTELMSAEAPEGLETVRSMTEGLPFTLVYVGMDGRCVGYFRLEDTIKDRSLPTIKELHEEGLKTVMLTGDNRIVAQRVADNLGIDLVVWGCRPETKLSSVEELEKTGRTCMIGDGMNDAPSLRRATVGISMGVMGNDVSVESSDVVFVDDDISKIPGLYRLCKRTVRTIVAGLILAMSINIAGTVLAMLGMIGPVIGAILHNGGSIIVILLATSLLWAETWAPRHKGKNQ